MSDLNPEFDLSVLGISDRLPNDTEVSTDEAEAAVQQQFQEQVQTVIRDLYGTSEKHGSEGGESVDGADDAGSEDASEDTHTSLGTDNATATSDLAGTADADVTADAGAEGEHDASTAPSSLSLNLPDGSTFELTQQHAEDLVRLASWANNLPEQTRYAFAAVESGQAVAIPRTEYESYMRWKDSPAAKQSSLADELEDISPETAARVRELEARVAAIPDASAVRAQAEAEARLQRDIEISQQTISAFQQESNLSQGDMLQLLDATLSLGIIPRLKEAQTLRAPDGRVLREADTALVMRQAFNMVRQGGFVPAAAVPIPTMPSSASLTSAAGSPTIPASPPNPAPSTTLPDVNRRVATKKARASSLASAPSTMVSRERNTQEPLSFPDMETQVAAALADAMRNGN